MLEFPESVTKEKSLVKKKYNKMWFANFPTLYIVLTRLMINFIKRRLM
jgi:hypothetical protein